MDYIYEEGEIEYDRDHDRSRSPDPRSESPARSRSNAATTLKSTLRSTMTPPRLGEILYTQKAGELVLLPSYGPGALDIAGHEYVGSYNWLPQASPTMVVPGK